jgi:elongation factor 1 alpha-like protein
MMHKMEKLSDQYGKASFKFAYVMDENEEERRRGVTIQVGQSYFET